MSLSRSVSAPWRLLLAVVLLAGLCSSQFDVCFNEGTGSPPPNAFDISGVDRFGLKLFSDLASLTSTSSNLLMSPYSIWSVLSLALMGAQGSTREQLQSALGLPSSKLGAFRTKFALDYLLGRLTTGTGGGPELRSIDRAYFDQSLPLRPCVPRAISNVETLDFSNTVAATDRINRDVSIATGGKITDLLSADALVNAFFVLTNAIYFKGNWLTKFQVEDTAKQDFYNSQGQRVASADMMTQQGQFSIVTSPAIGALILELPYDKSNMSMIILLPDIQTPSVDGVLATLSPYTLQQALNASRKLPVKVFLPKFDLKTKIETELVQALQNVGVTHMFDAAKANFSDFIGNKPLFADTAIHQATVKVDEVGTVAAAATAIVGTRSGPGQVVQFIANRPFVFLIYDKNLQVTLFAGVVRDPTK